MKRFLTIVAILSMSFAYCNVVSATSIFNDKVVKGSENYVTKSFTVTDFSKISITGSIEVQYTQQEGAPSVEAYGPDNIVELLDIKVNNGTLCIAFKDNVKRISYNKLEVRVASETLSRVDRSGSGDTKFMNHITVENLVLNVSGSGDLILGSGVTTNSLSVAISGSGSFIGEEVDCREFAVDLDGSGSVKIGGAATQASFSLEGSGTVDAAYFEVDDGDVSLSGSGSITCNVSGHLNTNISGIGLIQNVADE